MNYFYLFYIFLSLYALRYFYFLIGFLKDREKITLNHDLPNVSILVPARNEEHNIENCINSLSKLKYPTDKFEIIIINDRSEDKTKEIVESYFSKIPNLKLINIINDDEKDGIKGKAGAIHLGLKNVTNEIVFLTDADCKVNENWINSIIPYFEKYDFIASYTLINGRNLFANIQNLEWITMHTLAKGTNEFNVQMGCFGNNIALKKSKYFESGSYKNIPFSVTEDLALMLAFKEKDFNIKYVCSENSYIITEPIDNLKDYIKQHHRWIVGGKLLKLKAITFVAFSLCFWLSLIISLTNLNYNFFLFALLIKFLLDFILLIFPLIKLNRIKELIYLPITSIFLLILEFLSPFIMLKKEVIWKGQIFK